jgi:hypothetical protein
MSQRASNRLWQPSKCCSAQLCLNRSLEPRKNRARKVKAWPKEGKPAAAGRRKLREVAES